MLAHKQSQQSKQSKQNSESKDASAICLLLALFAFCALGSGAAQAVTQEYVSADLSGDRDQDQ